jgi:hypothetical protein
MLGYEHQLQFAHIMTQHFTSVASDMLRATQLAAPSSQQVQEGRSWYRKPAVNPFDVTQWLAPVGMPWAAPQTFPMMSMPYGSWAALASFANTMALFEPRPSYWPTSTQTRAQEEMQATMWQTFANLWQMPDAAQGSVPAAREYRPEAPRQPAPVVDHASLALPTAKLH